MTKHLSDIRFRSLGLDPRLVEALDNIQFNYCTPIQAQSLPLVLEGKDIAGQAQTGTGKTIAFLLATLDELLTLPPDPNRLPNEPRALIMAPTRELVVQIFEEAKKFIDFTHLTIGAVYGGTDYEQQKKMLERGVDLLVGTTGRLIDYYKQGAYGLQALDVVVLDEADRMFDLGFIADIRYLFRRMPAAEDRLSMLYSATLSHRVNELAYEHMNNPVHVQIAPTQITATKVKEVLYYPSNEEKLPLLLGLLNHFKPRKAMIFANTKRETEKIWSTIKDNGWKIGMLTGDVHQRKRLQLLERFKSGEIPVMVATDVAARGLHIDDVTHVFNYDLPEDAEDYVHRVGRTARAGAEGDAVSFACEDSAFALPAIEEYIGHEIPKLDVDPGLLAEIKHHYRKPQRNANRNRRSYNNRKKNNGSGQSEAS